MSTETLVSCPDDAQTAAVQISAANKTDLTIGKDCLLANVVSGSTRIPREMQPKRSFNRKIQAASAGYWMTSSLTFATPDPTIPSVSAAEYETSTTRPGT